MQARCIDITDEFLQGQLRSGTMDQALVMGLEYAAAPRKDSTLPFRRKDMFILPICQYSDATGT